MGSKEFLILSLGCIITMAICRVVPGFVLKGKQISKRTQNALNLIAPAAFAALVSNDIINPAQSLDWNFFIPIIAATIVFIIAKKCNSMIICCLAGIGIYTILFTFI